uniref:Uncharacterized protein n=1 Tax=Parascaris univalens TaxID=6257 RepID=A0A915BZY6_PARUN
MLMPKKRKSRNHVFEESHRAGFERRNFESAERLLRRVGAVTTEEIKEKRMLAKYELAGRDMRQVEADYKKMEESQERRKRRRLKQEMRESRKPNADVKHNEGRKLHKHKLSRKEAYRERRRAAEVSERNEMILDAKEVIAFGSRVDAPPVFSSIQYGKLESVFSKAGSKPLLLKSKLEAKLEHNKGIKYSTNDTKERKEAIAAERTRVIEAYRFLKKNRRNFAC